MNKQMRIWMGNRVGKTKVSLNSLSRVEREREGAAEEHTEIIFNDYVHAIQ